MRTIAIIFGLVVFGVACAAAAEPVSWGKANISFEQYRADAQTCARQGLGTALQQQSPNWDSAGVVNASDDYLQQFQMRALQHRHEQRVAGQARLDRGLTCLGYRDFRLTSKQQAHLATLAAGSQERREYLYSLAEDPAVLRTQGL